jgi:hypothetical protein
MALGLGRQNLSMSRPIAMHMDEPNISEIVTFGWSKCVHAWGYGVSRIFFVKTHFKI